MDSLTSVDVKLSLTGSNTFTQDPIPPPQYSLSPFIIYDMRFSYITSTVSYTPPQQWTGQVSSLLLPPPGPNSIAFVSFNYYITAVDTAPTPIGTCQITFNSTGNTTSGYLYNVQNIPGFVPVPWNGSNIFSIILTNTNPQFMGEPVYGAIYDASGATNFEVVFSMNTVSSAMVVYNMGINVLGLTSLGFTFWDLNTGISPNTNYTLQVNNGSPISPTGTGNPLFAFMVAQGPCLHGGSLVNTPQGLKRMDQLTIQDQVLTSSGDYAPINEVCQCWLAPGNGSNAYQALVIEKDALGPNTPNAQLILDPGHPIGIDPKSLKPAGSYAEGNEKIHYTLWSDISLTDDKTLTRYDLVLDDPHHDYMVHNLIIQSRKSSKEAGYDHWYQDHY